MHTAPRARDAAVLISSDGLVKADVRACCSCGKDVRSALRPISPMLSKASRLTLSAPDGPCK